MSDRLLATAAPDRKPSLGAFLNIAVHPDRAVARDLVRGSTAILARFATEGAPSDGLSEVTRAGIAQLASGYDEARHGRGTAPQAQALEDEFIDRFAVVGTAQEVTDRLDELSALGLPDEVLQKVLLDNGKGLLGLP